jgi:hypothetical protein
MCSAEFMANANTAGIALTPALSEGEGADSR